MSVPAKASQQLRLFADSVQGVLHLHLDSGRGRVGGGDTPCGN